MTALEKPTNAFIKAISKALVKQFQKDDICRHPETTINDVGTMILRVSSYPEFGETILTLEVSLEELLTNVINTYNNPDNLAEAQAFAIELHKYKNMLQHMLALFPETTVNKSQEELEALVVNNINWRHQRLKYCFYNYDSVKTIGDLLKKTPAELFKQYQFGKGCYAAMIKRLDSLGVKHQFT